MNFKKILLFFLTGICIFGFNILICEENDISNQSLNSIYFGSINRWDGYQINNVFIEVYQTVVTSDNKDDHNNSKDFTLLKIYIWDEEEWSLYKTVTIYYNTSKIIKINENIYAIKINKIVDNSDESYIEIDIKSNIESIVIKNIVHNGHKNAVGYGNPELKITKEISSNIINVDDILTITISIENKSKYDAYNILIQDPAQPYFAPVDILMSVEKIDILKSNEKRIVSIYKLKPIEDGIFEIIPARVSYMNKENKAIISSSENNTKIHVLESITSKPNIQIKNYVTKNHIKSYIERSKIDLEISNIGDEIAKNVNIKIIYLDKIKIESEDFQNNTIFIKELPPGFKKTYTYYINGKDTGKFEINTQYSYSYEYMNKSKIESGNIDSYPIFIEKSFVWILLKKIPFWLYLLPIPPISFIFYKIWNRYNEYNF